MSWEAFGSGDEPFDVDRLYNYDWESNEEGTVWWKKGEPETTFTLGEAIDALEGWLLDDD
jgi:hypothetical protein